MRFEVAAGFEERVRESFAGQPFMATMGAELERVEPGVVAISLPFRTDLTQQHGFLHAGAVASVLDSACGYAAFSLMPAGSGVLTVDYTINLMAPAAGERLIAVGTVIRPGRTLTVCRGEAIITRPEGDKTVSAMQATVMTIRNRSDVVG
jgi:uncharacterized protein (TIGR00369 family)